MNFEVNKTTIMQKRRGTFERTSFELRDFKRLYGFTKIIEVYFLLFTGFSDKIKSQSSTRGAPSFPILAIAKVESQSYAKSISITNIRIGSC